MKALKPIEHVTFGWVTFEVTQPGRPLPQRHGRLMIAISCHVRNASQWWQPNFLSTRLAAYPIVFETELPTFTLLPGFQNGLLSFTFTKKKYKNPVITEVKTEQKTEKKC